MGIYIFEPSGAGGSQTFEQVLNTGSTLLTSHTIQILGGDLAFYNGNSLFGQTNLNFTFDYNSGSPKFYFIDNSASAIQGIYIDPVAISYKFGEFYYGTGCIKYEPSIQPQFRIIADFLNLESPVITNATDLLIFNSMTPGALTQNTSAGFSGEHLKVKIDGIDYVIKLENP